MASSLLKCGLCSIHCCSLKSIGTSTAYSHVVVESLTTLSTILRFADVILNAQILTIRWFTNERRQMTEKQMLNAVFGTKIVLISIYIFPDVHWCERDNV